MQKNLPPAHENFRDKPKDGRSTSAGMPLSARADSRIHLQLDPRSAQLLIRALFAVAILIAIYASTLFAVTNDQVPRVSSAVLAIAILFLIALPLRRGNGHAAIIILSCGSFIYLIVAAYTGGGIRAPVLAALPLAITIPWLLLGRRIGRRLSVLAAILCVAMVIAEYCGWLLHSAGPLPLPFHLALYLLILGVAAVMTGFIGRAHAARFHQVQLLNVDLAKANQQVVERLREFSILAENLPALVIRLDLSRRCRFVNKAFLAAAGRNAESTIGQSIADICTPEQMRIVAPAIENALRGERVTFLTSLFSESAGRIYEAAIVCETDANENSSGLLCLFYDVTDREHRHKELRHTASHDPLTGLENRASIDDRLESALARAACTQGRVVLLVIDLDGFKDINDTYGHATGDNMLKHVAANLRQSVRASDAVGRMGGDEFAMVLEALEDIAAVIPLTEKIQKAIRQPMAHQANLLEVGASIGIAVYPTHGVTRDDLMKVADTAMYHAKRAGKNCARWAEIAVE